MKTLLLAGALAVTSTAAAAATVDFESILSSTNFPSPPGYSTGGLTFTATSTGSAPAVRISVSGDTRTTYALACDFGAGGNPCQDTTLIVDFGGAIDDLSLNVVSDENSGMTLTATFFGAGGSFVRTATGFDADPFTKDPVTFGTLSGATSVHLTSDDIAGVGYDDFMAVYGKTPPPAPVPLPAGLPLLAGGLGLCGLLVRRKPQR